MQDFTRILKAKGWIEAKDGSLTAPGHPGLVVPVSPKKPKPDSGGQVEDRQLESGEGGLEFSIEIIACRRRLVDPHDNERSSAKALVDAITASLGFDNDADPRLHWHYHQLITPGETGCIVKISAYEL